MKRFLVLCLALVICLLPLSGLTEAAGTVSEDYEPLWSLAEPYGFKLGGAFSAQDMNNPTFMDFLARHFNSLTCCNETKAYSLLDQQKSRNSEDGMPRMSYGQADMMNISTRVTQARISRSIFIGTPLEVVHVLLRGQLAVFEIIVPAFRVHIVHHADGQQIQIPDGEADLDAAKQEQWRCHLPLTFARFFLDWMSV